MLRAKYLNLKVNKKMTDATLRVEKGSHNDYDYEPFDPIVKLALVITLVYPIRQCIYWGFKLSLNIFKASAYVFGFELDYAIKDKPKWCWFQNLELPKYWVKRLD